MTKKLKITLLVAFALMLTLFAGVLAGCGSGKDDNAQIVVKSDMIKTEYVVGEELEITGGVLEYVSNGNTTHVQITKEMISNFSTEKVGSYVMIVTYNGKTTTVGYTVNEGFDLSKIYYSDTISPACWVKFDEQESKMYFIQGYSTAPEDIATWEQYGTVGTYVKSFKDGKLNITVTCVNPNHTTTVAEIKTISETSFDMTAENETVNFKAAKEFDITKIYHTDSSYGIWVKFNEKESKMYFIQGLTTAPKNDEEWEQYAVIATFTKSYKDGKLYVNATGYNPDQSTVTAEVVTISSSKISLTSDGATIELTAVN